MFGSPDIDPDPVHLYDKNKKIINDSVLDVDRGSCLTLNVHDPDPDLDPEANKSGNIHIQHPKGSRHKITVFF